MPLSYLALRCLVLHPDLLCWVEGGGSRDWNRGHAGGEHQSWRGRHAAHGGGHEGGSLKEPQQRDAVTVRQHLFSLLQFYFEVLNAFKYLFRKHHGTLIFEG